MRKYQNGYSINADGVVSQINPDLQNLSSNMYCVYNFAGSPDINNMIFGVNIATSANSNTPDKQKISSHTPITIQSINNNYIIGSTPRFAQHWRRSDEKN